MTQPPNPSRPAMTEAEREATVALSGHDQDMIANAWQGSSGRWYIDGRCSHLYAMSPPLCSLSGVLTDAGNRLRISLARANQGTPA